MGSPFCEEAILGAGRCSEDGNLGTPATPARIAVVGWVCLVPVAQRGELGGPMVCWLKANPIGDAENVRIQSSGQWYRLVYSPLDGRIW